MSKRFRSPVLWLAVSLFAIAGFTSFGPAERSLGANVRVVYLHGAWVWAALAAFMAAAGAGLAGLLSGKVSLHHWSRALGRTGLIFWVTYLPISVWAMQTNWNGLFLAEPRWRMALAFAAGGTLLQIGLTLVEKPFWASLGNLAYVAALLLALATTEQVMHPPAPVLTSDAWRIQLFFADLVALTVLAAWQVARWLHRLEPVDIA